MLDKYQETKSVILQTKCVLKSKSKLLCTCPIYMPIQETIDQVVDKKREEVPNPARFTKACLKCQIFLTLIVDTSSLEYPKVISVQSQFVKNFSHD